jgi:methyl-accepting chemotaxis protein
VEQSAAAAEHLSAQAQSLTGIVARFRIETT